MPKVSGACFMVPDLSCLALVRLMDVTFRLPSLGCHEVNVNFNGGAFQIKEFS